MLLSCPCCLSLYHAVSLGVHTKGGLSMGPMGSLWGPQVTLRNENLTENRI